MKKRILFPVSLIAGLLFSVSLLHAQDTRKVVAVINRADWCHVCQANGARLMKDVVPAFNGSTVQFVLNDLTNDATKQSSKAKLEEIKVYDAVKKINATGVLLLVDAGTGKLIEKISVAEPTEKLLETIRHSAMASKM